MGLSAEQQAWQAISSSPLEVLSRSTGLTDPWSRWTNAVCYMSIGDYRKAHTGLQSIHRIGPAVDARELTDVSELEGLVSAAIASGLRQLGEHGPAVRYDLIACSGSGAARVDGCIGLAADYVGLGQLDRAAAALAEATHILDGWRDRVRYHWVNAEVALLADETAAAICHAEAATAEAADSPRHLAKSLLFLGVAKNTHDAPVGDEQLTESIDLSESLQLRPLLWPAVRVLGKRASTEQRMSADEALFYIADRLPEGLGSRWDGRDLVQRG